MWEKFRDYSFDVSKYFITAMLVTALLGDITERWIVYTISIGIGGLFFWVGIIFGKIAERERREKRNKYRTRKRYHNKRRK